MSPDAMTIVLQSLDTTLSIYFGREDVSEWPDGSLDALLRSGILRQSDHSHSMICRECADACSVEVHFLDGEADEEPRAFIECPYREDIGRTWVPLEELTTYTVSSSGLAAWLATELGANVSVEEVIADRLWWLGGPAIDRRRADIFLVRGASWPDARLVFADVGRLRECTLPLVLVPHRVPTDHPFGLSAKLASLTRLMKLSESRLILDSNEIASVIGQSRAKRTQDVAAFNTPIGIDWPGISIRFVDKETVIISAGTETATTTFSDMGFADRRRANTPDKLWLMLVFMARHDGRLGWDDNLSLDDITKRKRQVSDIRKRLRHYFGIQSDPFEPYSQAHAYQARFLISHHNPER